MASFEHKIEKACKDLEIPGAVLIAESADGQFRYEKTFGVSSLKTQSPMKLDATMWLASCTKIMTTVAAMQFVERGQLNLDDDVTGILHELKDRQILTGFEKGSGEPILIPNTKAITLRHLLTHSSGIGYDIFNPTLMQYRAWQGRPIGLATSFENSTVPEASDFPLLFEPGDAWEYGVGIDWAGEMVSRVNGNMTLEEYLQKNVWGPLGMKDTTFHPASTPSVLDKLVDMSLRSGGISPYGVAIDPNGKVEYSDDTVWNLETKDCHGGAGGYGSPLEFHKLLHSICANDGRILKSATIDEMFKPQLTDAARASYQQKTAIPFMNQAYGGIPLGIKADWGLGGFINLEALPGRNAGSMAWGGHPNLRWCIDRVAGMSTMYGSQIQPTGDIITNKLVLAWAEEMYKRSGIKEKL